MAFVRQRRFAFAAALAAWIVACNAFAQAPAIDTIRRLVETGFSGDAWPLCAAIDRDAVPEADLWCGVAAVDVGRTGEGVLAIERYVLQHPNDVRARLELARAYYYAGDDVAARREFQKVRAVDPPPEVRAGIDRYLEAIEARETQYKPSIRGY
ncbi:MAG: tetratricopeptide repeat protein, partial [Vicinamibacteria bacterium]